MADTPLASSPEAKPAGASDDAEAGSQPKIRKAQAAPRASVNSVEPRRARKRAPRERPGPLEPENPKAVAPQAERSRPAIAAAGTTDTDEDSIPQSVRDRFVQDRERYYFPDGSLAFRDLGRRLTTPSENTAVIQGLVEIVGARGWQEITVRGSERFRQEAWRQARLSGLAVQGYRPTEVEQAAVVRTLAARRSASEREPTEAPPAPPVATPQEPEQRVKSAAEPRIEGRLLDHGRDGYQHDAKQSPSYYVRIQTPQGPREVWGQDLERAILKSFTQPQIGDEIILQSIGRDPVTVRRAERDEQGAVTGSREVVTHRNRWVMERPEFFKERAQDARRVRDAAYDPKHAVREHPALAGTYATLRAGELAAEQLRSPEDRRRFVALLRDALAQEIERGEPLRSIRLRDRGRTPEQREDERTAGRGFAR
jgi:Large polyvalent protein-associated domain 7